MFAAMTVGTLAQLATCREEAALLGLRSAFTSVTLPLNQLLRQLILGI